MIFSRRLQSDTFSRFIFIPGLFLALLLLPPGATAQEDVLRPRIISTLFKPVTIGIEGGLNFNFFSQNLTYSPFEIPESRFGVFTSGTGLSPYAALVIDLPLTSSLALQVKGSYDSKTFGNEESVKMDCPDVVGGTGQINVVDVDIDYSVTANYAGVGLGLRVDASPEIFFTVGPVAHFRVGDATVEETGTITTPGDCSWLDVGRPTGEKVMTVTATDSLIATTRFGMEAGVGYKIALGSTLWLVPQIRFQYMFSPMREDQLQTDASRQFTLGTSVGTFTDAMLHSLQGGLALWFRL